MQSNEPILHVSENIRLSVLLSKQLKLIYSTAPDHSATLYQTAQGPIYQNKTRSSPKLIPVTLFSFTVQTTLNSIIQSFVNCNIFTYDLFSAISVYANRLQDLIYWDETCRCKLHSCIYNREAVSNLSARWETVMHWVQIWLILKEALVIKTFFFFWHSWWGKGISDTNLSVKSVFLPGCQGR